MDADVVDRILCEHTTERLRVVTRSGRRLIIENPRRVIVGGVSLYIQTYDRGKVRLPPQARRVPLASIKTITPIRRPRRSE